MATWFSMDRESKENSLLQMVLGQISTSKIMKLDSYLTPYPETNSKWMKNLNVRTRIIKLVEESTGVNFCDFGLSIGFLNMTPNP